MERRKSGSVGSFGWVGWAVEKRFWRVCRFDWVGFEDLGRLGTSCEGWCLWFWRIWRRFFKGASLRVVSMQNISFLNPSSLRMINTLLDSNPCLLSLDLAPQNIERLFLQCPLWPIRKNRTSLFYQALILRELLDQFDSFVWPEFRISSFGLASFLLRSLEIFWDGTVSFL